MADCSNGVARSGPLLTRRRVLVLGAAAAAGGFAVTGSPAHAAPPGPTSPPVRAERHSGDPASLRRAVRFLTTMTDAYGTSGPRLAQSYADQLGLFSTAFTYDNALAVLGYLAAGSRTSVARARLLGDSLLYAQQHDPGYSDGRLRQAYNVGPYTFYDGSPQPYTFVRPDGTANIGAQFGFVGTAVGDMAWAGMALAQLAARTRDARYLTGARRIGDWIVTNTFSTQPLGGFTFGVDGSNQPVPVSSCEHNIDLVGFFGQLARLTGETAWLQHAAHARDFVLRMWEPAGGFFYTGTNDGSTVNRNPVPLDTQTWSWLALRDRQYAAALEWAWASLRRTDTPSSPNSQLPAGFSVSGVAFSTASLTPPAGSQWDPDAVWLEGTGQLAAALLDRGSSGDATAAAQHLAQVRAVQTTLGGGQTVGGRPIGAHRGVVAASSPIDTGFGFGYFQAQHVGATSWYVMAALRANPFQYGGV